MKIRERTVNGIRLNDVKAAPAEGISEILRQANAEGYVLLKNNGVLPLEKGERHLFSDVCRQIIIKAEQARADL